MHCGAKVTKNVEAAADKTVHHSGSNLALLEGKRKGSAAPSELPAGPALQMLFSIFFDTYGCEVPLRSAMILLTCNVLHLPHSD